MLVSWTGSVVAALFKRLTNWRSDPSICLQPCSILFRGTNSSELLSKLTRFTVHIFALLEYHSTTLPYSCTTNLSPTELILQNHTVLENPKTACRWSKKQRPCLPVNFQYLDSVQYPIKCKVRLIIVIISRSKLSKTESKMFWSLADKFYIIQDIKSKMFGSLADKFYLIMRICR